MNALEENSVPAGAESFEERREQRGQVQIRDTLTIGLVELLEENVADLERDAFAHDELLGQHLLYLGYEPGQGGGLVVVGPEELKGLLELEAEQHEILVDSIVVDLVPVEIEDVEKGLEPLLLMSHSHLGRM